MDQESKISPHKRRYIVRIEGHRGAGRMEPDNSIRAFQKAVELKLDGVELDVWLSADGVPIVCHGLPDRTVELQNGERKMINDIHLSELDKLILKEGEKIPTLSQVCEICKGKVCINIEFKEAREELMEKVLKLLIEKDMINEVDISSFQHINKEYLVKYSKLLGINVKIPFGFLAAIDQYNFPNYSEELSGDTINIDYRIFTDFREEIKVQITKAKKCGMGVKSWFPRKIYENEEIYQDIISFNVDTIIHDDPIRLYSFLDKNYPLNSQQGLLFLIRIIITKQTIKYTPQFTFKNISYFQI